MKGLLFAILCLLVFTLSVKADGSQSAADGSLNVTWTINSATSEITFSVSAKTDGWAGVGINTQQQMPNADVVVAYYDTEAKIYDGYATQRATPQTDVVQGGTSDITQTAVSRTQVNGETTLTFSFTRKLDTKDQYDVAITESSLYLLYARGPVVGGSLNHHDLREIKQVKFITPGGGTPVSSSSLPGLHLSSFFFILVGCIFFVAF